MASAIDVHQHLWPAELVDRLRSRTRTPYLRGWTLHTGGEPPYDVVAEDHDVALRVAADDAADVGLACLSLSSPLGIESLPRPEASRLIETFHAGVLALPEHFKLWASVPVVDPDLPALARLLRDERFVGVQLPATQVHSPAAWERAAAVLRVAEESGKPVFVHPGPARTNPLEGPDPVWWAPDEAYVNQMQAAWWGWLALGGRDLFPDLRVLFAAGAGLAPVHHERQVLRGGSDRSVDTEVFVDSSGYGPRALDALVRALGIDAVVLGSDRPYGVPVDSIFGDAATHAIRVTNPGRLLGPTRTAPEGESPWAFAS
ncbi:MAG: hypothetical protein JWO46_2597 [Nocardioidaceae bacterium]|nr:hypothetical protein [Nocardioidaceae bacterium]